MLMYASISFAETAG